jgi:hypothetical protein
MGRPEQLRAEEVVRTLAGAANAVRLYPPTSNLPSQAVDRFLLASEDAVGESSTLQVVVEPAGFKWGDLPLGDGQSNLVAFAEALYAHQVGKLIVAPGVKHDEVTMFLRCVASDTHAVRDAGGLRAVLKQAGVSRLAVIEVTLRASTEDGLIGVDLTTAPLDEVAPRLAAASSTWQETAGAGRGRDDVATAIGALEEAARELVARRLSEALMRLDEATRARVIAGAFENDATGEPMQGMLDVLARMKPAALARLLKLAAGVAGTSPQALVGKIELPPEAMSAVMMLLQPAPQSESARGVPVEANVTAIAADVAEEIDSETADLDRQIARATPRLAGGRALATTVEIATARHTVDAVNAVGEALVPAVRVGAYAEARTAIGFLNTLSSDVGLSQPASRAKSTLAEPDLLHSCITAIGRGVDPDVVGVILSAAGPVGADAVIATYLSSDTTTRHRVKPVLRSMGDVIIAAAGRRMRTADSRTAREIVGILSTIGDKRTMPILRQAMEHLDFDVRRSCLAALAETGGSEAEQILVGALNHWDPETRRVAAHEIGRAQATSAVPAMLRILQGYYLFERNYGLKKELIESLEALACPASVPTLRRMAGRRFVLGRKNRELQFLARRALAGIESTATIEGR